MEPFEIDRNRKRSEYTIRTVHTIKRNIKFGILCNNMNELCPFQININENIISEKQQEVMKDLLVRR